jgi:drug/metabolite transporter (DMT)-like permease
MPDYLCRISSIMDKTVKAHLYLLVVALIYGGNYIIAKNVMDNGYVPPLAFILFRVTAAILPFWLIGLFVKEKVSLQDHKRLILCAVFGVAINQMFFFYGLHLGTAIHASLLATATPIIVLPVSAVLIAERITPRKVIGILVGCVGAVVLILHQSNQESPPVNALLGDIMVFINAVAYAVYLVLVKSLTAKYHPVTISKWTFFYGWFMVAPFGWQGAIAVDFSTFNEDIWLSFIYVLLFTTFLAYLLNAMALEIANPSLVSIYIYLQPVIAVVLAIYLGLEKPDTIILLCAMFIFTGVYLVGKRKKQSISV